MKNPEPNSWEARDLRHVFHGFTDFANLAEQGPIVMSHGEGPHVFDVHGGKYLDANSGLWNMVAGFDHPGLTEAACAQYRKFPGYHSFFGRISDQTVALSEKLVEVSPYERGKVFFTNSGSEANDTMVKMLWMLSHREGQPERRKIISRIGGYHGVTAVSASMTGKPYNAEFGLPLPGFLHADCPHYWRFGEDGESEEAFTARLAKNLDDLIVKEGPETIAGFFAEPVMGAGGVIPPSKGYFPAIQKVLKKHGVPLISDEVICGFGRTGSTWGCETYGFMPDAIISSKNLSAGYFPIGAVILGPELTDRLQAAWKAAEEFPHGFTASGHPVGCAVSLKAIDVIMNEGLAENVKTLAPQFLAGLKRLAEHPNVGEARGVGLMGALEMVRDKATKESFGPDVGVGERIANAAAENGLICRPLGPAIVLCPPFIMTPDLIDDMFDRLERAMKTVFAEVA